MKKLTVILGTMLASMNAFGQSALECNDLFYYAAKAPGIECQNESHQYGDFTLEAVRVSGIHVNDWVIDHAYIRSMIIGGATAESFMSALENYLKTRVSFDRYEAMLQDKKLTLEADDNIFTCDLAQGTCEITDTNFDREKGIERKSFYFNGGLGRDTSTWKSYIADDSARVLIDTAEFEDVLIEAGLCDRVLNFRYLSMTNSMCSIEMSM